MTGTNITVNGKNYEINFAALDTVPTNVVDGGFKALRVAGNIIEFIREFGTKVIASAVEMTAPVMGGFNNTEVIASAEPTPEVMDTLPIETQGVSEVVTFDPTPNAVSELPVSEVVPTVPDIFAIPTVSAEQVTIPEVVAEAPQVTLPVMEAAEPVVTAEVTNVLEEAPALESVAFNIHKIEAPLPKEVREENLSDDFENKSNDFLESFAGILTTIAEMHQKIEAQGKMIAALQAKEQVQSIPEPVVEAVPEPIQLMPTQMGMVRQMGSNIDLAA